MKMIRTEVRRKRGPIALWAALAAMAVGLVFALPAVANHGDATLAGSNFEIDDDANLKVDHPAPSIDWASVTEVRGTDTRLGAERQFLLRRFQGG